MPRGRLDDTLNMITSHSRLSSAGPVKRRVPSGRGAARGARDGHAAIHRVARRSGVRLTARSGRTTVQPGWGGITRHRVE